MPLIASAVIGGVSSLFKIGSGIGQLNKANQLEKTNKRPVFNIQDEYFNNQSMSQSMAQHGLTDKAMDFYTTESWRGLGKGVDSTLQAGGGINSIQGMYDDYQRGLQEVAAKDAERQTTNIQYLIERNKDLAGQKTQKWAIDEYEPYKDKAKAAAAARAAGNQNISTGLSEGMGVATSMFTGGQNADMFKMGGGAAASAAAPAGEQVATNTTPGMIQYGGQTGTGGWNTLTPEQQALRLAIAQGTPNYKDMDIEDFYKLQYGDY
jgi:hypothetical protein